MTLDKELKLDLIKDLITAMGFKVRLEKEFINIINKNGVFLIVSKGEDLQKHIKVFYLDCPLGGQYGLFDFQRVWANAEDLLNYIKFFCLPQLQNIGGFTTIKQETVIEEIFNVLKQKNISFSFDANLKLKQKRVTPDGEMIESTIQHPCFVFDRRGKNFGIYLHQSYIALVQIDSNYRIQVEYKWFSFCPIYKTGIDYVDTTLNNFFEYIDLSY